MYILYTYIHTYMYTCIIVCVCVYVLDREIMCFVHF